jgi:hypothetical protein
MRWKEWMMTPDKPDSGQTMTATKGLIPQTRDINGSGNSQGVEK